MSIVEWNKKIVRYAQYFTYSEFRCPCGKCYSPAYLNPKLITYLDAMRKNFGKPVHITSGIRCKKYNNSLPGSSKTSGHLKGNAVDVYIDGLHPGYIVDWWYDNVPGAYAYYGTKNMGNCAHIEIK